MLPHDFSLVKYGLFHPRWQVLRGIDISLAKTRRTFSDVQIDGLADTCPCQKAVAERSASTLMAKGKGMEQACSRDGPLLPVQESLGEEDGSFSYFEPSPQIRYLQSLWFWAWLMRG